MTLKLFVITQGSYIPCYMVLWSTVPELHDRRIVCLLKAVTPAWVTNTFPLLLVSDYIHHSGSFDVLQAKVKCLLLVVPVRLVPRALNKHYVARGGPVNVSSMYTT